MPGYRLISELGRGSMGTVYLAVRERDQQIFAVKTILHRGQASPQAVRATLDNSLAPYQRDGALELPWTAMVTRVA